MAVPAILFVCMGNICRSPMAEGAMRALALAEGLEVEVDSAGTGGWHAGDPPDPRAIRCAAGYGIDIAHLRARQVTRADFDRFDWIVALDGNNLADLEALAPRQGRARLSRLLDHVPGRAGEDVADPYYGGAPNFEAAFADIHSGTVALLATIRGVLAENLQKR